MGVEAVIESTNTPATVDSLRADLGALGVAPGSIVLVHSSLSRLGYVIGGARAVVAAVLDAVGPEGTVVMPTHSTDLSDPATWSRPPVPESWWPAHRSEMPAYDPATTPTRKMGAIVECFRHVHGVRRSAHPTVSFAAIGPDGQAILEPHELANSMGEASPLARLYDLDARILLLGVGHANNTSLHLAEYRATYEPKDWTVHYSPVLVDGQRQWAGYDDLEGHDDDFEQIGAAFAETGLETTGPVGSGTARLMAVRDLVDFGATWMAANRGTQTSGDPLSPIATRPS